MTFQSRKNSTLRSIANRMIVTSLLVLPLGGIVKGQEATSIRQSTSAKVASVDQQAERMERLRRNQLSSAARQLEMRGNYEAALKFYSDLYDLDENRSDYFSGMVRNLVHLGRFSEAETLLKAKISSVSSPHDMINLKAELGAVYHESGQAELAEETWNQTIELNPASTMTYQTIASVMIRMRLLDKAEQVLRLGRSTLGDSTLFAVNLATLLQARMDWEGATEEYLVSLQMSKNRASYVERALAGFPDTPEAHQAVQEALKLQLQRLAENNEPWPGYRIELMELLIGQHTKDGQYKDALAVVRELDKLVDIPGSRLLDFAMEASNEGHPEVAEQALSEARDRFSDPEGKAVATMTLAQIYLQRGSGSLADSLLTDILANPVSSRVERSARYQRGLVRLELLDDADGAADDFRSLLIVPDRNAEERLRYYYAVALAKMDSLDAALGQLGKASEPVRNMSEPPPMPGREGEWVLEEADAGYLEARIAFWLGRPATATERLEDIFKPPTGARSENEALDLLHLVSTTEDSTLLELFAKADRAAFQGNDSLALNLYDSLAVAGETYISHEAAWRAAWRRFNAGQDSALIEYQQQYPEAVHAEEALFETALQFHDLGKMDLARPLYEDLLIQYPEGLLAGEARLRLDEIALQ